MNLFDGRIPIIAILRGVKPDEAIEICEALVSEGIQIIEVPLNSPSPFVTIKSLIDHFNNDIVLGAGTVLHPDHVDQLNAIGAKLMVTPNLNPAVLTAALSYDMIAAPGIYTPSEAFAAYDIGARYIKLFPAAGLGLSYLKNIQAVLPKDLGVIAVGGVDEHNIAMWINGGAIGVGAATSIYKADDTPRIVAKKARALIRGLEG